MNDIIYNDRLWGMSTAQGRGQAVPEVNRICLAKTCVRNSTLTRVVPTNVLQSLQIVSFIFE